MPEKDRLAESYNRDRKDRIDTLCAGPHGEQVREMIRFLKGMDLKSGRDVVRRAMEAEPWVSELGAANRHLLLDIVSGSIRVMREREGLPPFDDPMPGQPPNVFQQVKALWCVT